MLLVIVVILPTVCLLWFMTQAVKNERLAVRQKLIDVYQEKVDQVSQRINDQWSDIFQNLDDLIADNNDIEINTALAAETFKAIVYNRNGKRIYPLVSTDFEVLEISQEFGEAWKLELENSNFAEAIKCYDRYCQSENLYIRFYALLGKARCLLKMNDAVQAEKIYEEIVLNEESGKSNIQTMYLFGAASLRLAKLRSTSNTDSVTLLNYNDECELKLLELITKPNSMEVFLPLDQRLFIARSVIKDVNKWWAQAPSHQKESSVLKLIGNGEVLLTILDEFPTSEQIKNWPIDQPRRLVIYDQEFYAARHKVGTREVLYFRPHIGHDFGGGALYYSIALRQTGVGFRITDSLGRYVTDIEIPLEKSFFRTAIGGYFPDWYVELFFKDSDIFENAAGKQTAIYTWTGVLVALLILVSGGIAILAIGRQIKLNRLKNDFIATVTHELKTPLASMRVLVDTLLEGNYNDQKQATEYLQLISKENVRLSRLIDNFLTFSRMERNKQAFDIVKTDPAEIAKNAADAVKTKFNHGSCKFTVSIDENLPSVSADKDAMVTVLVNLLDNAYKYSYDNKQIELRVFARDAGVCFSVKDNGIGMTRRQARKVFSRFYQVDSSLSRRSEGTGLGLSIVKFIVDAHKGTIGVASKIGKGSVFTVKLS